MKTMKKLVAALLVLTMVLALTGTVAMADCKFKVGAIVRFTKNAYLYDSYHDYKKSDTIIRKGSQALIVDTHGSNWVKLQLTPSVIGLGGVDYKVENIKYGWFKVADLRVPANPKQVPTGLTKYSDDDILSWIYVVYSNKGNGSTDPVMEFKDTFEANKKYCHVKATSKVWLRKTYALKKSYGKALHDGDKVKYRHMMGLDTRLVVFYGVRYEGKNLWVSSEYSKLVK